jgi:hypothetical protein
VDKLERDDNSKKIFISVYKCTRMQETYKEMDMPMVFQCVYNGPVGLCLDYSDMFYNVGVLKFRL